MNVRQMLRRSDSIVAIVHDVKKIKYVFARLFTRSGHINRYLNSHETKKLLLGAGTTVLPGWLSTDLAPTTRRVMHLDATEVFPFDDNTFDYILCEHMIEHIPRQKGLSMLKECRRVLKPGGTLRLSTPDLAVFIGLWKHDGEALKERYIKWITDTFLDDVDEYRATFVLNNAFRNWGHQFLYDEETLVTTLRKAGFTNIRRCTPGESDDENLRGVESHGKNIDNEEMARFETIAFEANRPA